MPISFSLLAVLGKASLSNPSKHRLTCVMIWFYRVSSCLKKGLPRTKLVNRVKAVTLPTTGMRIMAG